MVKERVAATSEEESDTAVSKSAKKQQATARSVSKSKEPEPMEEDEAGGEEDEEEEEEYEIEAILDAKRGSFPGGRMGYFVKWKGYSEEHNSWVDELDAANAQVLIDEYWFKANQEKKSGGKPMVKPRKSTDIKGRKSVSVQEVTSESEPEVTKETRPKKRGRLSKASAKDDEEEEVQPEKKKRGRKSANGTKAKDTPEPMDEDEPEKYTDMTKPSWKKLNSWEPLVESIDTVERTEDNRLLVYFTLKNGKGRAREESTVCRTKLTNMLLDFYENNLRWRDDPENGS